MTVLVSTVKQMLADGKPIRAMACASTGDTSAALAASACATRATSADCASDALSVSSAARTVTVSGFSQ